MDNITPERIFIYDGSDQVTTNISIVVSGNWTNKKNDTCNIEYIRKDIADNDKSDLIKRNNELTRIAEELEYKLEKKKRGFN